MIPGFQSYDVARPVTRLVGRGSGGIAVYIRDTWVSSVAVWRKAVDASRLWLRFRPYNSTPLYLCVAYIPPQSSTYGDIDIFDALSADIADVQNLGGTVLLGGDFNARTGTAPDVVDTSCYASLLQTPLLDDSCPLQDLPPRSNRDCGGLHGWHRELLDLCCSTGIYILNGRTPGDEEGEVTCLSNGGSSTVDYFVASGDLLACSPRLQVISDAHLCGRRGSDSDHRPLLLHVCVGSPVDPDRNRQQARAQPSRVSFVYDAARCESYRSRLQEALASARVGDPAAGADAAVRVLQACIVSAAQQTYKRRSTATGCRRHQHKPWFDDECRSAKRALNEFIRTCDDSTVVANRLNEFKQFFKAKKRRYLKSVGEGMLRLAKADPTAFWRRFRRKSTAAPAIGKDALYDGFKALLDQQPPEQSDHQVDPLLEPPCPVDCPVDCSDLNAEFTDVEIMAVCKRLKRNKSTGIDGIAAEFILDASDLLAQPLKIVFNKMLVDGYSPALSVGLIHAIFKGGDASSFDNYRGITVAPVLAKMFAMLLESRLSKWSEDRGARAKGQAGFRKDYRTTDQLFILRTLIEQNAATKGRLYCCFVDLRKAFDTVPRDLLWQVLSKLGLQGRLLRALKSMYSQDSACVHHATEGLSSTFPCNIGVKQGCPLSPLLFGLFIDGLEDHLSQLIGDHPPELAGVIVRLLLYADDLAMMSTTAAGLQQQLDALQRFCDARRLTVNVRKTKIVVFASRKPTQHQVFYYDGAVVEQVDSFRYLGVDLHRTGSWTVAFDSLVAAGRKAMFALRRRCADLGMSDAALSCQLFDTLVRPVLSYACELWVVNTNRQKLELLHRMFLKCVLGVRQTTATFAVLAEFGRYPLEVFWWQQAIKYYERLVATDEDRLLHSAYTVQTQLQARSVRVGIERRFRQPSDPWLACLQVDLIAQGIDLVSTGVDPSADVPSTAIYAQRLQQSYLHQHISPQSLQQSTLLRSYLSMHSNLHTLAQDCTAAPSQYVAQPYLSRVDDFRSRKGIARFRCSNHVLQIEVGRHSKGERPPVEARLCTRCDLCTVENEAHFLLDCPAYAAVRARFEQDLQLTPETSLNELMNTPKQCALGKFIAQCFAVRAQN